MDPILLAQQQTNQHPVDDFSGFTPELMHASLYSPFDVPELIHFSETFTTPPQAPVLQLLTLLIEAIGEEGIKATAKGNLPIKLCREIAQHYWSDEEHYMRRFSSETHFNELHALRLTAKLAGLIRKSRGRFLLTAKCKKLLKQQGIAALYLPLLKTYTTKFNWGYRDGYDEFNLIQQSFLFTLHLLQQYGEEWRPEQHYTQHLIRAFPMVLQEVYPEDCLYQEPEQIINNAYSSRALDRFASYFGLAEMERVGKGTQSYRQIRKTPLLFELLHIHTPQPQIN